MPDIISIIGRHLKLIILLTLLATAVALIASLLSPKLYLSTATALPANPVLNDKARIFNNNVEGLYPSLGTPDELDRIEGTTKLDTLFIAVANDFKLAAHYSIEGTDAQYKAALKLKKSCDISRSAYGELKIKVWDKDKLLAAELANAYLQKLNKFHQHIQNANNIMMLQKIKDDLAAKEKEVDSLEGHIVNYQLANLDASLDSVSDKPVPKLSNSERAKGLREQHFKAGSTRVLIDEIKEDQNLINQYELSLKTIPDILVVVENARPALRWDKPNLPRNLAFTFFASLIFSFLLALFIESRNRVV